MPRIIRKDHPWYEIAGVRVLKARAPRDCHMSEHKTGWEGAIQPGDLYVYLKHAHINCCAAHIAPEDIVNG